VRLKTAIKKLAPSFALDWYYILWSFFGAVMFRFPSRKLTVIGVTGTSGKSTTVDFITRILEEHGHGVASLSSIRFKIGGTERSNKLKMTMPGRIAIQRFLRQAVNARCKFAVLEVTSEGIRQYRHAFINFNAAVFTNLTPEHIESHGSFENYRAEKLKLFKSAPNIHIINADDEHAEHFLKIAAQKIITFGVKNQENHSDIPRNIRMIAEDVKGNSFIVCGVRFHLNVLGSFNIYNALAAIAVAQEYGVPLEDCKKALEKITGIPGRMEIVNQNPLVVVDYAHTPVQLEQAYESLAPKPLVCVLGSCGGGRDKWKRPELGTIAQKYCKEIIITDEDPYDEDPLEIMEQVASGIDNQQKTYHIVPDRKEAIKKALELAKPEDAVIITGKGSELAMVVKNGKKIPWDDREIALEALK
jgi:UDP-N-acetylmuramoyl-L-alanyl-D-glutamate--2,6-diaminopimelate ligase